MPPLRQRMEPGRPRLPPLPRRAGPVSLQHDIRRLQLINQAKEGGASWAVIGATLGGVSGRKAKKDAHRLAARVRRDLIAAERAG